MCSLRDPSNFIQKIWAKLTCLFDEVKIKKVPLSCKLFCIVGMLKYHHKKFVDEMTHEICSKTFCDFSVKNFFLRKFFKGKKKFFLLRVTPIEYWENCFEPII